MAWYFNSLLPACVFIFGANIAVAETFSCTLEPVTKSGWIPARVLVQFLEGHEMARIRASAEGGAAPAVMKRRSDSSYLLDWTPSRALMAKATELSSDRYRAVLNLGNLKVSLQVLTENMPGTLSPRGAGTCIRIDGSIP